MSLLFFLVSNSVNRSKLSLTDNGVCDNIQCKSEELVIRKQGLYLIYCHLNFHFANCSHSPTDLKIELLINNEVNRQTLSTWCASDSCQEKNFKTLFQLHLTYLKEKDRISLTLSHPKFLNEIHLPNDNVLGVLRYSSEAQEALWLPTAAQTFSVFLWWQQPAFTRLHLVLHFLSYLIARVNEELCVPECNLKTLQYPHLAEVGLLWFGHARVAVGQQIQQHRCGSIQAMQCKHRPKCNQIMGRAHIIKTSWLRHCWQSACAQEMGKSFWSEFYGIAFWHGRSKRP